MGWLKENEWIFALGFTALGVVLGVVVPLVILRLQRKRKHLAFFYVDRQRVDTPQAGRIRGDIKVLVDGQEVNSPLFVTLRYQNDGNRPITEDDYMRPISLTNSRCVVSAKVIRTSDSSIVVNEVGALPEISFTAVHLNPRDYFDVQYLFDLGAELGKDEDDVIAADCKIKDETRSMQNGLRVKGRWFGLWIGFCMVSFIGLSTILVSTIGQDSGWVRLVILTGTIVLLFGLITIPIKLSPNDPPPFVLEENSRNRL